MSTDGCNGGIGEQLDRGRQPLRTPRTQSTHPYIAADRERVVVAWAEGDTADVCCRQAFDRQRVRQLGDPRLTSATRRASLSDYPTVALGDTVVVAWQEHRSTTDDDILACIDFGDTLNIADNATNSGYPHVLFQNIDSATRRYRTTSIWCD